MYEVELKSKAQSTSCCLPYFVVVATVFIFYTLTLKSTNIQHSTFDIASV